MGLTVELSRGLGGAKRRQDRRMQRNVRPARHDSPKFYERSGTNERARRLTLRSSGDNKRAITPDTSSRPAKSGLLGKNQPKKNTTNPYAIRPPRMAPIGSRHRKTNKSQALACSLVEPVIHDATDPASRIPASKNGRQRARRAKLT